MAQNNFILNLLAKLKINKSEINNTVKQAAKQAQNVANKNKVNLKMNTDASAIKSAQTYMKMLGNNTQEVNTIFGKLRNAISNTFSSGRLAMTSYLFILNEINKAGQNAKQTIKDIDEAITDLSIATDASRESVSALVENYNEYAKVLGSTTTQVTSAADDYLRAGKELEESQELIKDSIMLSKLGKLDSSEATEDLLATMNGFEMSVDEVGRALDAMVAIDMKAATSAGDIATALKYSASSADMAGVSFNKLSAMIGTVQDKTQQSAETIGVFFNTLLSRYRNVSIGQLVDDDGEDLSEVETVLKSLNIQLRDSNQEFRSFEDILDEVAIQWESYSSVQQAAISKAFSGSRQQNRFIALMEGYSKVLELTEVAANSAGTAVEKFNNSYMDSLEAKENTLQASFESLVMNSDADEVYKGIIEATTALIDFMNQTNLLKGVVSGLTLTVAIKAFLALKTGATEAYISLNQFQQSINLVNSTKLSTNDFTRLLFLTKNLSASQTKLILSSKNLTLTQKKQILMNQGLSASEAKLQLQNMGLTTSYTGLKAATISVSNAFKGLFATIVANPIGLIATAISACTMAWQSYKQDVEEANDKAKESADTADTLVDEISELTNKYNELAMAVATDESAKEDLLLTQEELLKKLGLESESIDDLVTKYGSLDEAIQQATLSKLKDAQIDMLSGLHVVEKELLSDGKGYKKFYDVTNRNIISVTGQDAVSGFDALEEAGLVSKDAYGDKGGSLILTGDDATIEGTLQNYEKLQAAMRVLQNEFSATELKNNSLFIAIKARADELEESVHEYYNSIESVNKGAMQIFALETMNDVEIPKTKEAFETFRQELIDTAIASEQFVGTEQDIANAVDNYLASAPDFRGFYSVPLQEEVDKVDDVISGISFDLDSFESNLKAIEKGYQSLMDAKTELEEKGFISASALTELTESGLLQYLELTKDGIAVNTEAFKEHSEAVKANAIQQLYSAMCYDVQALAMGNVDTVSVNVKTALEQAGLMAEEAGESALLGSEGWWNLGTSIASTMTALGVDDNVAEDTRKQIEATIEYYKNLANMVNDIDVTKSTTSGSSTSKDANLEEYKTQMSILEDELDRELISQKQFYEKSEKLLNQYLKNTPSNIEKYSKEISDAEKKLHDNWISAYEEQKSALDAALEDGTINAFDYYEALKKLVDEYYVLNNATNEYGNYTKEAEEAVKALKEAELDAMEQAISAVEMLYDKQIEKYEEAQEAFEKAQEEKTDAIDEEIKAHEKEIDSLDDLIEEKEKEIEALQEVNEEREDALRLQKAQESLDKALNNRSVAKIIGGVVTYVRDETAIREAEEELENVKYEAQIKQLEEEKELLEANRESIEKTIELLEKQQESIQESIDKSNEHFEKLIETLNTSKDRWTELTDLSENAKLLDNLKSVMGDMGLSMEDIYDMSDDAFTTFKNNYLAKLAEMNNGNASLNESLIEMATIDMTSTAAGVGTVTEGLYDVAKAAQQASELINGVSDDEVQSNSLTASMEETYNVASEVLPQEASMMENLGAITDETTKQVNNLVNALERLSEKEVNIELKNKIASVEKNTTLRTANIQSTINGFATGVKSVDEDQIALTQEEGAEIIISPKRKAIFTPLKQGDSVLNNIMTKNLWELAKMNPTNIYNGLEEMTKRVTMPEINRNTTVQNNNFVFNMDMPNITNGITAEQLANDLKSIAVKKFQFFNQR